MSKLVVENIGQLATLAPLAKAQKLTHIKTADLGILDGAWLCVNAQGKVVDFGQGAVKKEYAGSKKLDAKGALVLPGLVDAHTHPIFSGNRAAEFSKRLDGLTYSQIAAAGGGIKYSVKATRLASDEVLLASTLDHFSTFLSHGVTTVEAKTGYGLNVQEELRLLGVLQKAKGKTRQKIITTCLALHAVSDEFKSVEEFVRVMSEELLPEVKERGLADYVDAFVETGYFSAKQTEPYVTRARELGLAIRLHADEFSDSHAAAFAAEWQAASADHLQFASAAGIKAMAKAKTVAILLPGTSLYTNIPYTKAAPFRASGCAIAIATDFNPGSCLVDNLPLMATIGGLHCGLSVAETLAAVTYIPAYSLGLGASKGSLAPGFDADFSIQKVRTVEEWVADLGRHKPSEVWLGGERAL